MGNKLVLIYGPSGSGKTTLLQQLVAEGSFFAVKTTTSRTIRPSEIENPPYNFITTEQFQNLIDDPTKPLIEWNSYADNFYGCTKQSVKDAIEQGMVTGKTPAMILDYNGIEAVHEWVHYENFERNWPPEDFQLQLIVINTFVSPEVWNERMVARTIAAIENAPEEKYPAIIKDIMWRVSKIETEYDWFRNLRDLTTIQLNCDGNTNSVNLQLILELVNDTVQN